MAVRSDVRILIAGVDAYEAISWEIESNMLQPADAFSITIANPNGANKGKIAKFDTVVVLVDDTVQMTGYVDDINSRGDAASGAVIEIVGRDRFGQLVDTSPDPGSINGMDLQQIAKKLALPYVTTWAVDNEENRAKLIIAKRKYKKASHNATRYAEQLADMSLLTRAVLSKSNTELDKKRLARMQANVAKLRALVFPRVKIQPGESRMEVIDRVADKTDLMVWMAADGTGVIARPNYDQPPLFKVRLYPLDHKLAPSNNAKAWQITESGRELFSTYRSTGSSANTSSTKGKGSHHDVSTSGTATLERQKIISGSGQSRAQAKKQLDRDVQLRQFNSTVLNYTMQGHHQNGLLWQVDTIVSVEDQINGYSGPYFLTRRRFTGSKQGGQVTEIELHPPNVLLP